MITLARLDLVRGEAPNTAAELFSLQTQINAQPSLTNTIHDDVGAAGSAAALPATPSGYLEIVVKGVTYVMPLYLKGT